MTDELVLGIDVGTSGIRAMAVGPDGKVVAEAQRKMPAPERTSDGGIVQDAEIWRRALLEVVGELPATTREAVAALAIDGTSGTLLVTDDAGRPLAPATMYNDASAAHFAPLLRELAPAESGAHGASSPLARLLVAQSHVLTAKRALHQADWLAGGLTGRFDVTDENNALKLGYDPIRREWPAWFGELDVHTALLPQVVEPGTVIGELTPDARAALGLPPGVRVVAGTTDGCASFLATGADEIGDGVTALGSTLTVKLLSDAPVFSPEHGVYSHRLGDRWLVGGASNSGGAALLRFFREDQIKALTLGVRPAEPVGRDWHPLPGRGERFPVSDPELEFEPDDRPEDDVRFFQALLEGVALVEARAYAMLAGLGGPRLRTVRTVGGGAANEPWTAIRRHLLGVPMPPPASLEAAYGTALLARRGLVRASGAAGEA